jgi:hypothetical protein
VKAFRFAFGKSVKKERSYEREREREGGCIYLGGYIEPIRKYRNPLIGPPHRMYI